MDCPKCKRPDLALSLPDAREAKDGRAHWFCQRCGWRGAYKWDERKTTVNKLRIEEIDSTGAFPHGVFEEGNPNALGKFREPDHAEAFRRGMVMEWTPKEGDSERPALPDIRAGTRYALQSFKDRKNKWRCRLISVVNGQTILTSQGYSDKDAMLDTFEMMATLFGIEIKDAPPKSKKK